MVISIGIGHIQDVTCHMSSLYVSSMWSYEVGRKKYRAANEISMGSNIYLSLINVYTGPGPGRVSSADTCHVSGSEADLAMISDTQVGLFDV